MIPGALRTAAGEIELNARRSSFEVLNTGDRPIQVGSHFHVALNDALQLDRAAGARLQVRHPAGTSPRFEPGASRTIALVKLAGLRTVPGLQIRDRA